MAGGHMVSFGGNITFKSASNLREMVRMVPREQLLLETDTPYLSPEPLRGTQNEPANIIYTAQTIARELKIEVAELLGQLIKQFMFWIRKLVRYPGERKGFWKFAWFCSWTFIFFLSGIIFGQ